MYCHSCGSSVNPGSRFCGKCGAVLQYVDAPMQDERKSAFTEAAFASTNVDVERTASLQNNEISEQTEDEKTEAPAQKEVQQTDDVTVQSVDAPIVIESLQQQPYHQPYVQQQQNEPHYGQAAPPSAPPTFKPPYQQNDMQSAQSAFNPYPQNPPYPQNQPYQPYLPPPELPHNNAKPSKKAWKIVVPIVAAVALIATALLIYFLVFLSSPTTTTFRALSNIGNEVEERIDGTPLEMFGLLLESLQNGTVSVDFEYSDLWSNVQGSVTLHSDESRGAYAAHAGLSVYNISMDLDFYMNRDAAAARLRQIDDNYYGIVFDTFGDDFRSFANVLGLSRSETDEVISAVEMLADLLRGTDDNEDSLTEEYEKLLGDFIQRLDVTSERVDIMSGGSSVRAQKIDFVITDSDIADLFDEFFIILENDDNMRGILESNIQSGLGLFYTSYDDFLREIRREVRSFTRSLSGEITVTFYISSNNRLLRIEINTDLAYDGDAEQFDMSIDFGASATDIWVFEMNAGSGRDRMSLTLEWEMRETSSGSEIVLRLTVDDRWSNNEVSELTLSWTDRGNFTLSVEEELFPGTILSGVYTRNDDGFRLEIDDPYRDSFWGESLSLTITASNRVVGIEDVDFINIVNWGESLLERIEDFLGFGGNIFTPDPFPTPTPPPGPGTADPDLIGHELLGAWSFSGGMVTYFFWSSDFVLFDEEGVVMADGELGVWSVDGNYLTVVEDFGQGRVRHYHYEIVNGILYITDSDDDTGEFERLW